MRKKKIFIILFFVIICSPTLFWLTGINLKIRPLNGTLENISKPVLTISTYKNGEFQKNCEKYINRHIPLRPLYVRLNNQLYYSLFNKSYMQNGNLTIGKKEEIYEQAYISEYYNYDVDKERIKKMSYRIKSIENTLKKKYNKTLIFVITPSKAICNEKYIPSQFINYYKNNKKNLKYKILIQELAKNDLDYVDGLQITQEVQKRNSEIPLFSKGGTHWSNYAASFTLNSIIDKINKKRGLCLPLIRVQSYVINNVPEDSDDDLYKLINIINKPSFQCVHANFTCDDFLGDKVPTMFVTGSFSGMVMNVLAKTKNDKTGTILGPIDYLFYYKTSHITMKKGEMKIIKNNIMNISPDEWREEILANDVIVLEQNVTLPMDHIEAFLTDAEQYL